MKRNIYLLLAFLVMGVAQASAQQIAVYSNDGSETKHEESAYEMAKITFSNGQMLVHYGDVVKGTYNIKDIARIKFYERDGSSVGALNVETRITYSSKAEELIVHAAPGTVVRVYRTCGECVLSRVQTIAAPAIDLAHLPAGAYIAVVGSETLKFVKQ